MRYVNLRISFATIALFGLIGVTGCEWLTPKSHQEDVPLARVGETYLFSTELQSIIPQSADSLDSIQMARNYINKWVEKQVLLQKAEQNLTEAQKDIEKELEDYKHSLLLFRYQTSYVNQALDTQVTDAEIEAYYKNNPDNFQLRDFVVQADYVIVDKNAPKLRRVERWAASTDNDDREKLIEYAVQFAKDFHFDEDAWLYVDELFQKIPIQTLNTENFLKQNTFVTVEDSMSVYYLKLKAYKLKDDIAPLSLQREFIRNIILNKRKLNLISTMKKGILDEAKQNQRIEYYP